MKALAGDAEVWLEQRLGHLQTRSPLLGRGYQLRLATLADRDAILNHFADYMTNGPVMAWQSKLNDASRPLPVFWKGVKAAEVEFYKEFLETPWSDSNIWMVSPATIYEADLKTDEFIERQILRLGLDYIPLEDRSSFQ